jgi:hypothetical protein
MAERLCPRCGAYWQCGCIVEEWRMPVDAACVHDWSPAVAVEVEEALPDGSQVVMCRHCGLFAVGIHETRPGAGRVRS